MERDIKSFLFRVPLDLFEKLKAASKERGQSINSLCVSLLRNALGVTDSRPGAQAVPVIGEFSEKLFAYIQGCILPTFSSHLVGVMLFGSAARNELRKGSDIDLLVVLQSDFPLDRDSYNKIPAMTINGHSISPLVVHYPSGELATRSVWLEAAVDGCILYDTDLSLSRLLIKIRDTIVSGAIVRGYAYGVPYWIHQTPQSKEKIQ